MSEEPVKRVKKKGKLWIRITITVITVCVVLFAFLWELVLSGKPEADSSGFPHKGRSAVQDELDSLSWLSPDYLPLNEYSRPGILLERVNTIVIHYIGNPGTTAEQNRNYFAGLAVSGETHASSNFIIGLEGEIVQCVPVDEIAYASNNRNDDTLSIELCHPDETGQFTDETYASAIRLTAWLCERFSLSASGLIRHYDVSGKECPKHFVENEDAWETFKADVAGAMG